MRPARTATLDSSATGNNANPGGRPATLESLFRAEIQEEGMDRFVKKLAYLVES